MAKKGCPSACPPIIQAQGVSWEALWGCGWEQQGCGGAWAPNMLCCPQDAAPGDVANALGPLLGDEDHGRLHASMGPWDTGDADVAFGNHVERDLAEHNGLINK